MINIKRMVEELRKLVSIDAVSFQEREIADVLINTLLELGFEVKEDKAGAYYNGNCGNLYGYLQGELEGDPILFSAHMDTVEPGIHKKAVLHEDGKITSDGTTVLGADDLAGIVSILEAIRSLKEQGIPHRSIEILFPIAEEVYIRGSEIFDFKMIKSKEAYILDLDGPVGTAAIKAPTLVSFTAKIIGKASHAGFAPEQGIHAIKLAADTVMHINQGRIDEETTVNIGMVEGGKARNIVPEFCTLKGEVRSLKHQKALDEIDKINKVLKDITIRYNATYEFETSFGCFAYEVNKEHPVVLRFKKVCNDLDYQYKLIETFGGSDNNNFIKHGITGIVLACGMNQVHSCEEYTSIEELTKSCNIVRKLMTSN